MKFLKQFIILIVALISIVLIVALFVQKDFQVTRSVEIERSSEDIYDYIRYLENHESFAVWTMKDPNIEKSYTGPEGNIGSTYKWDSKVEDVGAGEQEIIDMINNKQIDFELRFKKPWESTARAYFELSNTSNATTKVTWGFKGTSPWPWNIMLLFMNMDENLGPDLEKGLNNLKEILEVEG